MKTSKRHNTNGYIVPKNSKLAQGERLNNVASPTRYPISQLGEQPSLTVLSILRIVVHPPQKYPPSSVLPSIYDNITHPQRQPPSLWLPSIDSNDPTSQLGRHQLSPTHHVSTLTADAHHGHPFHQQLHSAQPLKRRSLDTLEEQGQTSKTLIQAELSHGSVQN